MEVSGMKKKKLGILVSGNGSNLQAIIDSIGKGEIDAEVAVVISNKPEVYALERASLSGITTEYIEEKEAETREEYDQKLITILEDHQVELVLLAGFMRILSPAFIQKYKGKLMNIHPSLLPSFPGLNAQQQALEYGVKVTGATVHFVDEGLDSGPIIIQSPALIQPNDTLEILRDRILRVEHWIYPQAVKLYLEGKLRVEGKKVIVEK